MKTSHFYKLGD